MQFLIIWMLCNQNQSDHTVKWVIPFFISTTTLPPPPPSPIEVPRNLRWGWEVCNRQFLRGHLCQCLWSFNEFWGGNYIGTLVFLSLVGGGGGVKKLNFLSWENSKDLSRGEWRCRYGMECPFTKWTCIKCTFKIIW